MKKKKIGLEKLKVNSFVTSYTKEQSDKVKGGMQEQSVNGSARLACCRTAAGVSCEL